MPNLENATQRCQPFYGFGKLAAEIGYRRPLRVMQSAGGYYIGTDTEEGGPCSRESVEYFRNQTAAEQALVTGTWSQRMDT